jgi:dTDP-L-rhamnose 4-epimerase
VPKTLVTGGAGLIGSHLVDELLRRGAEVRILDNLSPSSHRHRPEWIPAEAEFVLGDVRDRNCLDKALRGVEDVYHLAAAVGGVTVEVSEFFDVNATGTARLFEAIHASRHEIRKLVAPSSQSIFGEGLYRCPQDGVVQPYPRAIARMQQAQWEPQCPICGSDLEPTLTDEGARLNGETPYAVSKIAEERLMLGLGKRFGIPVSVLRYAVVYGPRQSVFNPYTGILSIFSTLILNNRRPHAFEDGRETRDFVYVSDVVDATILAMEAEQADGAALNVGRGVAVDIVTVIEKLSSAYGREPDYVVTGEFRPGDVRHLVLDASRMKTLGWAPRVSLDEGLGRVAAWFAELGGVEDLFSGILDDLRRQGVVFQAEPD